MAFHRCLGRQLAWMIAWLAWIWPQMLHADDLALAAGETVNIAVYGRDDLSGDRVIDPAGRVLVPLLGRVDAMGATPEVLEARITAALTTTGLAEGARVFVDVVRRRDVFVDGDVMTPGAYAWQPSLTAGQLVTLAGGMRRMAPDALGTMLQAYGAQDQFAALQRNIAALQAHQARLQAEMAFTALVFDPDAPVDMVAMAFLNVQAFASDKDATQTLATFDIAQFRQMQMGKKMGDLIIFPASVVDDPAFVGVRRAEQALMENSMAIDLANLGSLHLQRRALDEKARSLTDRRVVIDGLLTTMQDRMTTLLALRDQGLVRVQDVVDMQTAFSTLTTTQLELLSNIADTQIAMQQQDLAISSFAATRHRDIAEELTPVVAALTEAEGRLPGAQRAAAVADAYRTVDTQTGDTAQVRYQISGTDGVLQDATASTMMLPGQSVFVTIMPDQDQR
jgi:protein involved in polysaccharide export with SLBB domain